MPRRGWQWVKTPRGERLVRVREDAGDETNEKRGTAACPNFVPPPNAPQWSAPFAGDAGAPDYAAHGVETTAEGQPILTSRRKFQEVAREMSDTYGCEIRADR